MTTAGSPYDLVLAGGAVHDPASGRRGEVLDVAVSEGRVAAVGTGLAAAGREVLDCSGLLVLPGLVDLHSHVYSDATHVGIPPDEGHLARGVVAVADAGTAGASSFAGFKKFIVDRSDVRIVSFLNVSVLGLVDHRFGELLDHDALRPDEIAATVEAHPDIIRGLKIRLSTDVVGSSCLEILERAVAVGERLSLPVMAHVGRTNDSIDDIVGRLRPGDIVTHCYTWKENGILTDGRVSRGVAEARERGVVFDVGHGTTQLAYKTAQAAMAEGFYPDTISSDLSANNWRGPAFDLATVMSKFLAMGMPLEAVVRAATRRPAEILGLVEEGYGAITPQAPAYLVALRPGDVADELPDAQGSTLSVQRLEPVHVVQRSTTRDVTAWRGPALAAVR